jgi:hypothetical protein
MMQLLTLYCVKYLRLYDISFLKLSQSNEFFSLIIFSEKYLSVVLECLFFNKTIIDRYKHCVISLWYPALKKHLLNDIWKQK